MNTQNYLAFYSNLILQGDFAASREFHLHVTFITELQKYMAVYSIQLILQGDFATSREFHLHVTFITELQKYLAVYSIQLIL